MKQPKSLALRPPTSPQVRTSVHGVDVTLVQRSGTPLIETAVAIPTG